MPAIDFKEIPVPTKGPGRDQFELFASEFLQQIGFKLLVGPDRGADAGRDLVVEETRTGIGGQTTVKWLVSCKHKAHSGASVSPDDESDIHDRVKTHGCAGFIGFYSTVPSTGLAVKLNSPGRDFELEVFDPEKIERHLLVPANHELTKRFFPISLQKWKGAHPVPAKLFAEEHSLRCENCDADLLHPKPRGIVVAWQKRNDEGQNHINRFYWCCKGACDKALAARFRTDDYLDAWEDISDIAIPTGYIKWVMALLNNLKDGDTFDAEAFDKGKIMLLNVAPFVFRDLTEKEQKRMRELMLLPAVLGGFGS